MNVLGTNWKTNLGAIGVGLGTVATVITQVSSGTFHFDEATIATLVAAGSAIWGLFSAKDVNVHGGTIDARTGQETQYKA